MTSTQRLELEIDLLEKRMEAVDTDRAYRLELYNEGFEVDGFPLVMRELNRDHACLVVEIAEKRLSGESELTSSVRRVPARSS